MKKKSVLSLVKGKSIRFLSSSKACFEVYKYELWIPHQFSSEQRNPGRSQKEWLHLIVNWIQQLCCCSWSKNNLHSQWFHNHKKPFSYSTFSFPLLSHSGLGKKNVVHGMLTAFQIVHKKMPLTPTAASTSPKHYKEEGWSENKLKDYRNIIST